MDRIFVTIVCIERDKPKGFFCKTEVIVTGVTIGAGTAYPYRAPQFIPGFSRVRVTWSLVFCVVFSISFFVPLSFFNWSLCCLSFFDLRLWHLQTLLIRSYRLSFLTFQQSYSGTYSSPWAPFSVANMHCLLQSSYVWNLLPFIMVEELYFLCLLLSRNIFGNHFC